MRRLIIAPAFAVLTALPAIAQQQEPATIRRSNTSKLMVELGTSGSAISLDGAGGRDYGSGLTLRAGYGFTQNIAALVDVTLADIRGDLKGSTLSHLDLGVRYHFANASRAFVPFLDASVSSVLLWQDEVTFATDDGESVQGDIDLSGTGWTLGGGLLYFFRPQWALSGALKWTRGSFDELTIANETVSGLGLNTTTTRVTLGVAWFPLLPKLR